MVLNVAEKPHSRPILLPKLVSNSKYHNPYVYGKDEKYEEYDIAEQFTQAINSLLIYYDKHSQGRKMSIPLIGSGAMSRFNKDKQSVLETLVSLIKINDDKLRGGVKVIVHKVDKTYVSIRNFYR